MSCLRKSPSPFQKKRWLKKYKKIVVERYRSGMVRQQTMIKNPSNSKTKTEQGNTEKGRWYKSLKSQKIGYDQKSKIH